MKKLFILIPILCASILAQAQDGMGIGNNNPQELLDVSGAIKIGGTIVGAADAGSIRWNGTNFQGYDGSQWVNLDTGSGTSNTLDGAYDQGGAGVGRQIDASDGAVRVNGDDGFIVTGGPTFTGDPVEVTGAGNRMFYNPYRAAFRAGTVSGSQWDDANLGSHSLGFGYNNLASGVYAIALGNGSQATGHTSFATGRNSVATGQYSMAMGDGASAVEDYAIALGDRASASGITSIAIGRLSTASNYHAVAIGTSNTASGSSSFAAGTQATSSGSNSVALGNYVTASGPYSLATGRNTVASGNSSSAFGDANTASGPRSFAFGDQCTASGEGATAGGIGTSASGDGSVALGFGTFARSANEIAIGRLGTDYTPTSTTGYSGSDRILSVGNGTSNANRSDAMVILKNGNVGIGTSNPSQLLELGGTAGTDGIMFPDGTVQTTAAGVGTSNTLDQAYDQGGAGAGRQIDASDGAVRINGEDGFIVTGTLGSGDAIEVSGAGSRMFFNPQKAAFRAGMVDGTQWDDSNIGDYSAAFGRHTIASGIGSFAANSWSQAHGASSFAVGNFAVANGPTSVAIGAFTQAESLSEVVVGVRNTLYTPTSTSAWVPGDRLFVVGNGSSIANRSDAMVILKNGNVGIGTSTPSQLLELGGTAGTDGIMFPDGTVQTTAAGAGAANTLDQAYDQGGAGAGRQIDASDGAVRINGEDGFIVTGTLGSGDAIEVSGAGSRMFFNPQKAAFRAGHVTGTQWDDANVGLGSVALGSDNVASGLGDVALGRETIASGGGATAMGSGSVASGFVSFAAGHDATATKQVAFSLGESTLSDGPGSFAAGNWSIARSSFETVFGSYNTDYTPTLPNGWSSTDRLFVVGNSVDPLNRSDAMVILKNGATGIGTSTPSATLDVEGSFQFVDGNQGFGKVLASDANGNAAWVGVDIPPSTVPLWNSETGTGYSMTNTTGQDLNNCDAGFIPTSVSASGNVQVKVVIMVASASGTNQFQLRSGADYPVVNTDTWTWTNVGGGRFVVESEWKAWSAGTTARELRLFGWQSGGGATFTNAYVLVKPN